MITCTQKLKRMKRGPQTIKLSEYERALIVSALYFWVEQPPKPNEVQTAASVERELADFKKLIERF